MTRVASISMCSHPPAAGAAPAAHAAALAAARAARTRGRCAASIRSIDQPPHRGRRGCRAEGMLTIAAQLADPVNAVRAVGDRGRQIGEHLPGRIHPRTAIGVRQTRR